MIISKTLLQALLFGIITVLLGLLFMMILSVFVPELPKECEQWNKYYVFEMLLFFTGVSLRLIVTTDLGRQYLNS